MTSTFSEPTWLGQAMDNIETYAFGLLRWYGIYSRTNSSSGSKEGRGNPFSIPVPKSESPSSPFKNPQEKLIMDTMHKVQFRSKTKGLFLPDLIWRMSGRKYFSRTRTQSNDSARIWFNCITHTHQKNDISNSSWALEGPPLATLHYPCSCVRVNMYRLYIHSLWHE